jgi:hypothetical protein
MQESSKANLFGNMFVTNFEFGNQATMNIYKSLTIDSSNDMTFGATINTDFVPDGAISPEKTVLTLSKAKLTGELKIKAQLNGAGSTAKPDMSSISIKNGSVNLSKVNLDITVSDGASFADSAEVTFIQTATGVTKTGTPVLTVSAKDTKGVKVEGYTFELADNGCRLKITKKDSPSKKDDPTDPSKDSNKDSSKTPAQKPSMTEDQKKVYDQVKTGSKLQDIMDKDQKNTAVDLVKAVLDSKSTDPLITGLQTTLKDGSDDNTNNLIKGMTNEAEFPVVVELKQNLPVVKALEYSKACSDIALSQIPTGATGSESYGDEDSNNLSIGVNGAFGGSKRKGNKATDPAKLSENIAGYTEMYGGGGIEVGFSPEDSTKIGLGVNFRMSKTKFTDISEGTLADDLTGFIRAHANKVIADKFVVSTSIFGGATKTTDTTAKLTLDGKNNALVKSVRDLAMFGGLGVNVGYIAEVSDNVNITPMIGGSYTGAKSAPYKEDPGSDSKDKNNDTEITKLQYITAEDKFLHVASVNGNLVLSVNLGEPGEDTFVRPFVMFGGSYNLIQPSKEIAASFSTTGVKFAKEVPSEFFAKLSGDLSLGLTVKNESFTFEILGTGRMSSKTLGGQATIKLLFDM